MARNSAYPVRTWQTSTWIKCEWFQELPWQLALLFQGLTGMPEVSPCGTLEMTPRLLCQRLNGMTKELLLEMIGQLSPYVEYFPEHNTIWIRGFYDHQNMGRDGDFRTAAHRSAIKQAEPIREAILAEYPALTEPYHRPGVPTKAKDKPARVQGVNRVSTGCDQDSDGTLREGSVSGSESQTGQETHLARFQEFWDAYWRGSVKAKSARSKCESWFITHKVDDALVEAMLSAIAWQSKTEQWNKDGGQFRRNPITWLNQKGWTDEKPPVVSSSSECDVPPVFLVPREELPPGVAQSSDGIIRVVHGYGDLPEVKSFVASYLERKAQWQQAIAQRNGATVH